jgi:hypothetical protein
MSTEQLIKELAKDLGVSATDVSCLANSVANSIKKDKFEGIFCGMSEQDKSIAVQAYAIHECKKFGSFVTQYQTNPAARHAFRQFVLEGL